MEKSEAHLAANRQSCSHKLSAAISSLIRQNFGVGKHCANYLPKLFYDMIFCYFSSVSVTVTQVCKNDNDQDENV